MKKIFLIASIAISMILSPAYSASPKIKTIFYNSRTIYKGFVLSKQPCGEGKLYVVKSEASSIEDGNHDLLTGTFSNQTVNNATLKLSSGITFVGVVQFEPTSEGVNYTLSNGAFKYKIDGKECEIPVKQPQVYKRSIVDRFSITPSEIAVKSTLELSKDELCRFIPVGALKSFMDADTVYGRRDDCLSLQTGGYSASEHIGLDFGNLKFGSYDKINKYEKTASIRKINGDYLRATIGYGTISKEEIKKTFSDGTIIYYDSKGEYNKPLEFGSYTVGGDDKPHYTPSNRIEMDMSEEILQRYRSCSLHDSVQPLDTKLPHTYRNVKIEYNDGSVFVGKIYAEYASHADVAAIAAMTSCPKDSLFYEGLFTASDNKQQVYNYGRPLEYLEHAHAIQHAAQDRQYAIEKAEREKARQAERAEQLRKREPLYNKYGKKYVDALLDDGKVLIGTPEGLVVHNMASELIRENQYSRVYKVGSMFNSWAGTVYVNVKTGKVESVTLW